MGAKNLILTHFSQRFSKLPSMDEVDRSLRKLKAVDEDEPVEEEGAFEPLEQEVPPKETPTNDSEKFNAQPQSTSDDLQIFKDESTILSASDISHERLSQAAKPAQQHQIKNDREQKHSQINSIQDTDMNIAVAFDYMNVRVKDIKHLEKFTPAIVQLYEDEAALAEAEDKAADDEMTNVFDRPKRESKTTAKKPARKASRSSLKASAAGKTAAG